MVRSLSCLGLLLPLALLPVGSALATPCPDPDLVGSDTVLIDPAGLPHADLVWTGSEFGLVATRRQQLTSPNQQIVFMRIEADGTPAAPVVLQGVAPFQPGPDPEVVWDGAGYGASWYDDAGAAIRFQRISAGGVPIGSPVTVAPYDAFVAAFDSSLVWTGSEYVLVWSDDPEQGPRTLKMARLDAGGALQASPIVLASNSPTDPSVAAHGSTLAVAWIGTAQPSGSAAQFRLFTPQGTPMSNTVTLFSSQFRVGRGPNVLWTGTDYTLLWNDDSFIFATTFTESGVQGAMTQVGSTFTPNGYSTMKLVDWTGTELLVAWVEVSTHQYRVQRATADGTPLGPSRRVTRSIPGNSYNGGLAWTGTDHALVWIDETATGHARVRLGRLGCGCSDDDGDEFSVCSGDCNDSAANVHPQADELCDAADNDCDGFVDEDFNATTVSCGLGICRRTVPACEGGVSPTCEAGLPSPEACNGLDDNCDGITDNADADGDTWSDCSQDCDPGNPVVHPDVPEICNGLDDNCDGLVDERGGVVDEDGDGIRSACDDCPGVADPGQADQDRDGAGDACDNCALLPNPGQEDVDHDHLGDACDGCPTLASAGNDDADHDTLADACDNCLYNPNPDQTDVDQDGEGDACDADDGLLMIFVMNEEELDWDAEPGFLTYDVYRGDLDRLKQTGESTQDPATVPLAYALCGWEIAFNLDEPPPVGKGVFYLVAATTSSGYLGIGSDSAGHARQNPHGCP